MTSFEVRLRPDVAVDWLARTWLPGLLSLCDRDGLAQSLAEGPPLTSPARLRDVYAMGPLASTLRGVRAGLAQQLHFEQGWARESAVEGTVARFGGPARFRGLMFPHLDEVTGFVARTVPARDVGVLLRSCVELAIEVVVAGRDNDDAAAAANGVLALTGRYDAAVAVLARMAGQRGGSCGQVGEAA